MFVLMPLISRSICGNPTALLHSGAVSRGVMTEGMHGYRPTEWAGRVEGLLLQAGA